MTTTACNLNLCGYEPIEEIYRNAKTVVYRAMPARDRAGSGFSAVVIKVLAAANPTSPEILKFCHQYTIAKDLDLPGVVRLYSLEECDTLGSDRPSYAIVMEDFGAISLAEYQRQHRLTLSEILDLAIQIADTLHALGKEQIVHKDLKPANLTIHPTTKQVKLIDFSIASLLPNQYQKLVAPDCLEGTLAYLSPEQTGRMNRGIDYRADFYALGVTLYELLTGKLPFDTQDPLELIHCHLAKIAIPASEIDRQIPSVVSNIVAKLMSKNAEDRYQSALGLKYDLERCQAQLTATGTIVAFELGKRDVTDRFIIAERLYGRELEVKTMLAAYARVAGGSSEFLTIAGASGMGKTALVNEIHRPITRDRGYFIKGKFDLSNRNHPFSAFVRAFRDLIGQLLSHSDLQLAEWRHKILAAIGDNGRVLIEVIPELECIIGTQPDVAELTGTAAQNRFNWLFAKFIEVFTTAEHPLTIFLDDLQWADAASWQLIKLLMAGRGYLLLLGTYRDNEVSPSHPLMLTIAELTTELKLVETITLTPLTCADTNRLIADTLHCAPELALPLAEIVQLQTQGNPFFTTQLLKAWHEDGLIWFDFQQGGWVCDMAKVAALAVTDDVVAFMATQLQKLPPQTQSIFKLAACIGNRFDLNTLAIVSQQSHLDVAKLLWQGLQAGLILPVDRIYKFFNSETPSQKLLDEIEIADCEYRFLHDRVQEAAYSLIPAADTATIHAQIGGLLLAKLPATEIESHLFAVTNHLNRGIAEIVDSDERLRLVELNLSACRKAKSAHAHRAAIDYAQIAIDLLGERGWKDRYELNLVAHELAATAAFLGGEFDRLNGYIETIDTHARTVLDRVKISILHIQSLTFQHRYSAAVEVALSILDRLGINFPSAPTDADIQAAFESVNAELGDRSIADLFDLPQMVDVEKIAIIEIIINIIPALHIVGSPLRNLMCVLQVKLSILYGSNSTSAVSYAMYAVTAIDLKHQIELATAYGRLAVRMVLASDSKLYIPEAVAPLILFIIHRYAHLSETLELIQLAERVGLETGKIESVGDCGFFRCLNTYWCGKPLIEVANLTQLYCQKLRDLQRESNANNCQVIDITARALMGDRESIELLTNLPIDPHNHNNLHLQIIYLHRAIYRFLMADLVSAKQDIELLKQLDRHQNITIRKAAFNLYDSAIALAQTPASAAELAATIDRVTANQQQLGEWAESAPMNYLHKWQLIEAEKYRVMGQKAEAIELYDLAIAGAKAHEYLQETALANELAAKFYLAWDKPKIAASYLQDAYDGYARWGATAKTDDLKLRYADLLAPILKPLPQLEFNSRDTLSALTSSLLYNTSTSQSANTLDLVAVLKSAQSLTSTIEFDELIHQLHQIILQNSGAQICMLALPDRENRWHIHSHSVSGAASISTLSQHIDDSIDYPANLIYWVKNTQQPISCNARQPLEIPDRYLQAHQPQSVFALPILKQDTILGVLYLEHRQAPNLFADCHKAVISFLCNQAAIAIDNANRYQESLVVAENLRLQQSYLEALLHNIPHMAWIKDRDSRFIAVNRACAKVSGCEPIDMVGKTDLNLFPEELANAYRHDDFAVMASGERKVVEERSFTTAGEPRWLETMKMPMRNSKGEITGTVGIALDITDRKLSEIALRHSEERYHQIVSNIPAALFQVELTEHKTYKLNYASTRFSELFDLDAATAISDITVLFDLVVPEDRDSFERSLYYTAVPWQWEGRILTPTGKLKWIRGESGVATTAQGKIVWDGILFDITDRKQTEIALRESEARYHRLADNLPGLIYQLRMAPDGSLSYPYISSGCWELFELSPAAVMADANILFEQLHPDDRAESDRSIAESARSLTPKTAEGRSVLKSGEVKWIKSISRPERQPDGAIVWDGMMFDTTERQQIEIALRASEDRYHQLVSNVPGALYQFELTADATTRLNYVSTRFYQLLEISPTEDIEDISIWFDRVAPEDLESFMHSFHDSARLGHPWEWEGKWLMPSGKIKWLRGESTQQTLANGSIVWDGMLIDITDRKQVEMELLASKQFLQTVIETFPIHVFWKDRQSRYLGCNQLFASAAGVSSPSELVGKNDYDLPWDRAEIERYQADDAEVITTERPKLGIIETLLQADGNCYWLETNKVPLRNPHGETIGVLGTFQNVTDREQAQIALRLTNERLELTILELQRATRLKDEFLATMSHELRTPLNAILGMSEALYERVFGSLNEQQLKSIQTISRGGRHLLSLINDILDVSKISAGKLELDIGAVSIAHLCNSSLAFVRQQALQKQIQLDLQLSPVPGNIAVDERRMRQVAINLLGNAVKFTPPGGRVVLRVSQQQTDDRWDWELSVTDTGIGIAPQDLDRLFQPFVQLDSRLNRQHEGTGLGLTLVKQIVELHGGKISVRSELDRGSCFTVKLPYVCALSGAGGDLDADPSTGNLRPLDLETFSAPLILLAEDNAANINTLSSYLNAKGYRTILATTGLEAIRILEDADNDRPDLILMDIQMPEMDGLEAIDRIRNHLHLTTIPIIALTALAMPGDREKCLAAGANEYLTKPVQLKQLATTIQQLLRASG